MTQAVLGIETSTGLSQIQWLSDICLRNNKVFFISGTVLQFPETHNPEPGRPESCQGPGVTGFLGRAVSPEVSVMDLFPFGYRASSRDAAFTFG